MAIDKRITDLPVVQEISGDEISVLAKAGTDFQFLVSDLLQYVENNIQTGAKITFGETLPQNTVGEEGDLFINTKDDTFAQKLKDSWVIRRKATNGTGTQIYYNSGPPDASFGNNGDTYINTWTGTFYQKTDFVWNQVFSMQNGPPGPPGPRGDTGTSGKDGNGILNGSSNPSNLQTGNDGDFYINTSSNTLFGPKENGAWENGIPLGSDAIFEDSWTVSQPGNPNKVNGYHVNTGDSIASTIKAWFRVAEPYTYIKPTVSLTATPTQKDYEIGETINITLNGIYTQNNGGAVVKQRIVDMYGDEVSQTNSALQQNIEITADSISYTYGVDYGLGPVRNDSLGDLSPAGQIQADTIWSLPVIFNGYKKAYISTNLNGAYGGDLLKFLDPKRGYTTASLKIPAGTSAVMIALPADFGSFSKNKGSKVIYVEDANTDITDNFVFDSTLLYNYPNGNGLPAPVTPLGATNYNLYKFQPIEPFPSDVHYIFTL